MELNKIKNIDCLEYMKDLDNECVDLIVTDPPYLIDYKTNYRNDKNHEFCSTIKNDNNPELISEYIKECYRIMKENTAMYMFCSMDKVDFFKQELEKYFKVKNIIIWVKNNWTAGEKQYEMIILVNKGRALINGKRLTDVWKCNRVAGKSQLHQNEKPLSLIRTCIKKHSNENDVVFDGFMGSGTTAVACKELKRNFIGTELEKKYYNICIKRLNQESLSEFT